MASPSCKAFGKRSLDFPKWKHRECSYWKILRNCTGVTSEVVGIDIAWLAWRVFNVSANIVLNA